MRRGAKQNAITNSPIVRSLIKNAQQLLPLPPPDESHLILTQPIAPATIVPPAETSIDGLSAGQKRKRDPQDDGRTVGSEQPPPKKVEKKDESGSLANEKVNYTAKTLPASHKKYWAQRHRLFSLFDEGVQMDLQGWYSVTPEPVALQIAERCRSGVVLDAFCGVGGNAIQFAFTCEKVIAIDNSPTRLACAAHNAKIYGVEDRITFILGDFLEYAEQYTKKKNAGRLQDGEEIEVVFLSPPWGGIDYREAGSTSAGGADDSLILTSSAPMVPSSSPTKLHHKQLSFDASTSPHPKSSPLRPYPLSALSPLPGPDLFAISRAITPHVAFFLPRNVDLAEVAALASDGETVEIEEEWMSNKLKAVTAYFGGLATSRQRAASL